MPVIPTYTKREFIKTPDVAASASAPLRANAAYENGLTRTARVLSQVLQPSANNASAARANGDLSAASGADNAALAVSADEDLHLRETLVDALQKDLSGAGGANGRSLENAAAKHFTPQTAGTAAARDYAVLHRAAQDAQQAGAFALAQQAADKEKTLTCQVGALVRSPQVLDVYLSEQLPAYEERLRENGQNREAVCAASRAVQAQTVEENVCRSLACGDWKAAEATLGAHADKLDETVRQTCAAKTRAVFARGQAEKLWQQARLETGGPAEQAGRHALENLNEPDPQLRAEMRQALQAAVRRESAQEHLACAQTLASAAGLSSADAVRLLDGKNTLPADEWDAARQAALALDGDVTRSDAAHYLACYFNGTQKEHARLWKREKISSRDYLRLEAARHRRQGGKCLRAQELLCRGIDVWMRRKGFSAQDVFSAQYAVLTADAPDGSIGDVWKQIKNLLDV